MPRRKVDNTVVPSPTDKHEPPSLPSSTSPSASLSPISTGEAASPSSTSTACRKNSDDRVRKRHAGPAQSHHRGEMEYGTTQGDGAQHDQAPEENAEELKEVWLRRNRWMVFAVASGACAAFNGAFAKLTTNDLTSHMSQWLAASLDLSPLEGAFELVIRGTFFGLNLIFNGVMWTLFTKALALGTSTTRVSIMNTSTNFLITALLGLAIFSESLPPLWWVGAALLVAGNVIIGQKDEEGAATGGGTEGAAGERENDLVAAESGRNKTRGSRSTSTTALLHAGTEQGRSDPVSNSAAAKIAVLTTVEMDDDEDDETLVLSESIPLSGSTSVQDHSDERRGNCV